MLDSLEDLHKSRRMSVYQRSDSLRGVVLDREASATGCYQEVDIVLSVTGQAHRLLNLQNVIGNNLSAFDSPLTIAFVGENIGESIPGLVR